MSELNNKIIAKNKKKVGGKIILGLVGQLAAGKGTVADYLKKNHRAITFRFSDSLREALELFDLEISRENMQNFSTLLRKQFGENTLAKAMAKRVKNSSEKLIVIDGVRRPTDIENLINLEGFHLVHVVAEPKIRYQRQTKRAENIGDSNLTFEQFLKNEQAEADRQIPKVGKNAKFKIDNSGSLDKLYKQVERILKEITD